MRSVAHRLDPAWRRHVPVAWLEGWTPVEFDLGDGTTEVVATGEGPPLLLLPPLPGWKEAWLACVVRLSRRFHVVTFDLRSRFAPRDPWAQLAADLDRVADAFAPGRVVVAGHSLGGALAQRWALLRPARVAALVLSSSFARVTTPRGDRWSRFVEQPAVLAGQRALPDLLARPLARSQAARGAWVYDAHCGDDVLDFVRFCVRRAPLPLVAGRLRLALAHDTRAGLPRLACPTLVVYGACETRFVREAAAELVRLIPGAERRAFPEVAHLHLLSRPAALCDAIGEWAIARAGAAR